MNKRTNEGYEITDSIRVGDVEFVLGSNPAAPAQYVTWRCNNGTDYYWGRYFTDIYAARRSLYERALEQNDLQSHLARLSDENE